jgi:outer membrane protein OmpA-like peptidoglycan-associated protein
MKRGQYIWREIAALRKALLLVCVLWMTHEVSAQTDTTPQPDERMDASLGAFIGGNRNLHRVNFFEVPDYANIIEFNPTPFTEGDGWGLYGGLMGEVPLTRWLRLSARASVVQHNAFLRAIPEAFPVGISDGSIDSTRFQRTMDVSLANVGLQLLLGFQPFDNFTVYLGGRADFAFEKQFRQIETILEPTTYGRFENGLRTRNPRSGPLPDIRSFGVANMNLALMAGLGYELPLNAAHSLTFAPEIFYSRGMTTIITGRDFVSNEPYLWQTDNIHGAVALRWYPARAARFNAEAYQLQQLRSLEKQIAQERATMQRELKELKASGLSVRLSEITGIMPDGQEIASPTVRVEEFRATKRVQLLPYVFFNENSSVIPARYRRYTASERMQFRLQTLEKLRPMDTYYNILNVVGKRLSENLTAKIVIVGNMLNVGAEKDNRKIARQRAESVSDYFQDVWKIPAQRIDIREQVTPNIDAASEAQKNDLAAEFRRVELISDTPEILAAVEFETVQYTVNPPSIRFGLNISAGTGLKQWSLEVSEFEGRETKTLLGVSGGNTFPQKYVWNIDADERTIPAVNGSMDVLLTITDVDNRDADAPLLAIPTEIVKIADKQRKQAADKRIRTYTLGLLDTDPAAEQLLQNIKASLKPGMQVFLDSYGDEKRKQAFAQKLGVQNARASASEAAKTRMSELLKNDASTPEGRLYNRSVRIELHEPLK